MTKDRHERASSDRLNLEMNRGAASEQKPTLCEEMIRLRLIFEAAESHLLVCFGWKMTDFVKNPQTGL